MTELTLEDVVKRLEAVERELAEQRAARAPDTGKDWRGVVGVSEDNEFTRLLLSEIEANSEAEWKAAQEENPE